MSQLLTDLAAADNTSALGDLGDGVADRTVIPIPVSAITRKIQICGVNASDEDIANLADNIQETRLVHPIEVSLNEDGTYTLTKGNGRLLAHVRLGSDTIPAFVDPRPVTDATMAEFIREQAAENAHRKHLTILETLNTIEQLANPPCNSGRNAIGRVMRLPETTLKRYWRIYRSVRDRDPHWHPTVAAWLNSPSATWIQAAAFAADPAAQLRFAESGALPGRGSIADDFGDGEHTEGLRPPTTLEGRRPLATQPHRLGRDRAERRPARTDKPAIWADRPPELRSTEQDADVATMTGGPNGPLTKADTPSPAATPSPQPPDPDVSVVWDRLREALQDLTTHRASMPVAMRKEIRAALMAAAAGLGT